MPKNKLSTSEYFAYIRRFLDFESCLHVVRTLVLSRLDYGNSLLFGAKENELDRLQRLQNWAAKLIFKARKDSSASSLLSTLHWLPLRQRFVYKLCFYNYVQMCAGKRAKVPY